MKEVKKYLELETSDNLFYFFKSNGILDFNKKIIAGIILYERDYDTQILHSEKLKIKESIEVAT